MPDPSQGALPLYINGRFATQSLSGVQRFAVETATALDVLRTSEGRTRPLLLTPPLERETLGLPLRWRTVGKRGGQAWEQGILPGAARAGILINLGNTAPILVRRQIVVLHDAGVFSQAQAYSWKFRAWYKSLHGWLSRNGSRVVTVSEFSKQELVRNLRIAPERVDVIPEGCEHALRPTPDPEILARHGLSKDGYVLAVGTLAAHKNLRGLSALARACDAAGLKLVISGGLNTSVFGAGGEDRLPQPATYVGRVSDEALRALFDHAACFVFPSFYEGFGLPPLEAMACGCPVVAADIPVLREVLGDACAYADPYDQDAIAKAVLAVATSPETRARLSEAGRARASGFTWARTAEALQAILDRTWPDAG